MYSFSAHITAKVYYRYLNFTTIIIIILLLLQIRTFTRSCNGKAACNCAIAVKSGDDVILIDRCGYQQDVPNDRPTQIKMLVNGELTPGTRVVRKDDGKAYDVKKILSFFLLKFDIKLRYPDIM